MSKEEEKISAATWTMDHIVSGQIKMFESDEGEPYCIIPIGSTEQVWHLDAKEVAAWLARKYFDFRGKVLNNGSLKDVINTMKGYAHHGMRGKRVWLRMAEYKSDLVIDLGDDQHSAVHIHNGAWDIITKPPVHFRRAKGVLPLAIPARDGDLSLLRRYINCPSEPEWRLLRAWIVSCWRASGPFPILVLSGQQGAGKSTMAEFIRTIIDPNKCMLRQKAKSRHDFIIASNNSWILAYDNLSFLDEEMADALCCISTGTGFTCRALFTNLEEVLIQTCRPIITTSIEDIATRSDLLDRSLLIHCQPLDKEQRRSTRVLREAFTADLSLIVGGLCNVLAEAHKRYRYVREKGLPRMADWARLGIAIEQALNEPDGSFLEAYQANLDIGKATALDASVLVPALTALMAKNGYWQGTGTELLQALRDAMVGIPDPKTWPKLPTQLSNRLNRLAPHLSAVGLKAATHTTHGVKIWTIQKTSDDSTPTTPPQDNSPQQSIWS